MIQKKDDHQVHTIPSHHPTQMDVLPKTFFQIIHAAKWLVRHSSTVRPSINKDDLCLPFCLYPSSMSQTHSNILRPLIYNLLYSILCIYSIIYIIFSKLLIYNQTFNQLVSSSLFYPLRYCNLNQFSYQTQTNENLKVSRFNHGTIRE